MSLTSSTVKSRVLFLLAEQAPSPGGPFREHPSVRHYRSRRLRSSIPTLDSWRTSESRAVVHTSCRKDDFSASCCRPARLALQLDARR